MNQEYILNLTSSQQTYLLDLLIAERESLEDDLERSKNPQIIQSMLDECNKLLDVLHEAKAVVQ